MPQPVISLVVARGRNGVIGRDGDLPWRLRSDLQRFKAITIGKPCLMGRKTWESLPLRPLPGRLNLVLTRDQSYEAEEENVDEICIIGGTALFEAALPRARRLYVTEVDAAPEGDARFPDFDPADWTEVSSEPHEAGEKDDHAFTFRVLERR